MPAIYINKGRIKSTIYSFFSQQSNFLVICIYADEGISSQFHSLGSAAHASTTNIMLQTVWGRILIYIQIVPNLVSLKQMPESISCSNIL